MIFSSIFFLYFFLPIILVIYYVASTRLRNVILLIASLIFYAWGEVGYVILMIFSIGVNWILGVLLERAKGRRSYGKKLLILGIVLNLLPLAFFKYGNFLVDNLNNLADYLNLGTIGAGNIHLPIGISFFTFQAISYLVDVYRKAAPVQYNLINLALYISLFPQLIAGPIVRYHDVARQIVRRHVRLEDFQYGIQRFVVGLGKKVLIANNLGAVADHVFALPPNVLPGGLLWLGMITFTLQIYYDFSGYSDMAIGLGRMFGFHFLENFNYPYCSRSIKEFWRRWHISLSSWFRDYLYIPMGGNRKGPKRTHLNLFTVFFLCGLWHGASWTFILWGLYHGMFLVLERGPFGRLVEALPGYVRNFYAMLVVMVGWVFFRAENLGHAVAYLVSLPKISASPYLDAQLFAAINAEFYIALVCAIIFMYPVLPRTQKICSGLVAGLGNKPRQLMQAVSTVWSVTWIVCVVVYSSAQLISGSHNPFLYFRF
ncbi:MAG: MBOAT family O-acyltransferase [Desulforhopalus sp.]